LALVVVAVLAVTAAVASGCGADSAESSSGEPNVDRHIGGKGTARPAKRAKPIRFTVSASGDLLMHQPLLDRARANGGGREYDFRPFFRKVRPYVAGVDLALCHVETPMGPGPPSTYPIFNTPTGLAASIRRSGWDACSTASNHSNDQGQAGIDGTVAALHRRGVGHTGSFASRRASRRPTIVSVHGVKIGFVAYTDATNGIPAPHGWSLNEYAAASPAAGARAILADARRARRAGADAVIVNIHWGTEYARAPNASQLAVAGRLTRSRHVDAVVAQGPHVVQPIRRMNGKFVVFSEGNLVSNQSAAAGLPAATQDGLIALFDFNVRGDRVRVRRVRYAPVWVRPGDYVVLPARAGADPDHAQALRESYARTVSVAGRDERIRPAFKP
jgi:poly-gamma-glutamate synthesis protein (capsule biosynthesis protein)